MYRWPKEPWLPLAFSLRARARTASRGSAPRVQRMRRSPTLKVLMARQLVSSSCARSTNQIRRPPTVSTPGADGDLRAEIARPDGAAAIDRSPATRRWRCRRDRPRRCRAARAAGRRRCRRRRKAGCPGRAGPATASARMRTTSGTRPASLGRPRSAGLTQSPAPLTVIGLGQYQTACGPRRLSRRAARRAKDQPRHPKHGAPAMQLTWLGHSAFHLETGDAEHPDRPVLDRQPDLPGGLRGPGRAGRHDRAHAWPRGPSGRHGAAGDEVRRHGGGAVRDLHVRGRPGRRRAWSR